MQKLFCFTADAAEVEALYAQEDLRFLRSATTFDLMLSHELRKGCDGKMGLQVRSQTLINFKLAKP